MLYPLQGCQEHTRSEKSCIQTEQRHWRAVFSSSAPRQSVLSRECYAGRCRSTSCRLDEVPSFVEFLHQCIADQHEHLVIDMELSFFFRFFGCLRASDLVKGELLHRCPLLPVHGGVARDSGERIETSESRLATVVPFMLKLILTWPRRLGPV